MTEDEMRKRMKEIDKERERLKVEKQKYEKYFSDKDREKAIEQHDRFVRKCFITNNFSENDHKHIKAFKILKVLSEPNEDYAECIAIVDGYRSNCWNEFGIQVMTLSLWVPNKLRLMSKDSDPKMIDMYHEISEEEFVALYNTYKHEMENKICE